MADFALCTNASAFWRSPSFIGASVVMYMWPDICPMSSAASAAADTIMRHAIAPARARKCHRSNTKSWGMTVPQERRWFHLGVRRRKGKHILRVGFHDFAEWRSVRQGEYRPMLY